MAELSIDIPVIQETTDPKGILTRRNSTGIMETPSGGSTPSRYLRAYIGSCHDFCKSGSTHASETKAKSPLPKKLAGEGPILEETVNLSERKKKPVITLRRAASSIPGWPIKKQVPSTIDNINVSSTKTNDSVERGSDPKLKFLKPKSSSSLQTKEHLSSSKDIETRNGNERVNHPINPLGGSSRRRRNIKSTAREEARTSILTKKKGVLPRTISRSPKHSVKRVSSPNAGNYKNCKGGSQLKNQNSAKKEAEPHHFSIEEVPEKTLHIIEPNAEKNKHDEAPTQTGVNSDLSPFSDSSSANKTLPPSHSSSADGTSRNTRNGIHTTRLPPSSGKKKLRHTRSPPSLSCPSENKGLRRSRNGTQGTQLPSTSLSSMSLSTYPRKSRGIAKISTHSGYDEADQFSSEDVPEKTLHIVEPNTENKHEAPTQNAPTDLSPSSEKKNLRRSQIEIHGSQSPPSISPPLETKSLRSGRNGTQGTQLPSPDSAKSSTGSEYDETGTNSEKVKWPRKGGVIGPEDKSFSPRKQKFKRGKVVELQSKNTSPKKLKFRLVKEIAENENGKDDTEIKKLLEMKIDGGGGKLNITAKIKPEKVVLRHQNVEGKKDAQLLFNNVIEETASKLAATRKSKVKALVGAFETVISLQDIKSSTRN